MALAQFVSQFQSGQAQFLPAFEMDQPVAAGQIEVTEARDVSAIFGAVVSQGSLVVIESLDLVTVYSPQDVIDGPDGQGYTAGPTNGRARLSQSTRQRPQPVTRRRPTYH